MKKIIVAALALWLSALVCSAETVVGTVKSADGVAIRYEVRGAGEPTLLFVHCWMCDRTYWTKQLEHLASRFTVVALDLAGHGESGLERTEWGPLTYACDVAAVADALKLKKLILIGHSMGGPVAAQAALLLGRERVLAVIGVDTLLNLDEKPDPKQYEPFFAAMRGDFAKTTEGFIRSMMFPAGADPDLVTMVATDMAKGPANVGIASMQAMMAFDAAKALEEARVPVYCINGDKFPTNVEAGKKHAIFYKARILPGTGHFLYLEKPTEFNKLLDETLEEILAGK
jgi:pimeloyl-ACP methyl ester carboxylesterase